MILFTVNNLDGVSGNKGEFILQMEPTWAPIGVERVIELTTLQFWNGCRFFRVLPDFMAQFGIAADPSLNTFSNLIDDPVKQTNARGTVSFATSGPDTRSTQLFINTNKDGNAYLDRQGFAPIGKVIKGMDVVDRLYNEYGEGAPNGQGPRQGLLYQRGNEYLEKDFPRLSYIVSTQFLN
jgi:peptidyl-prolyl cis-trans isomerase A (cyclophilin A)